MICKGGYLGGVMLKMGYGNHFEVHGEAVRRIEFAKPVQ